MMRVQDVVVQPEKSSMQLMFIYVIQRIYIVNIHTNKLKIKKTIVLGRAGITGREGDLGTIRFSRRTNIGPLRILLGQAMTILN
jgi:CTP synthase (UTP-ammonia lyase)